MAPVAQYDLRDPVAELLRAGFPRPLVGYLEAPALVAAARLPGRRHTPLGPLGSLGAMVQQTLFGCSQAACLLTSGCLHGPWLNARSGALSKARPKVAEGPLEDLAGATGRTAWHLAGEQPVRILDGSCCHLLDTPANQQQYPRSSTQHPGAGWPQMHIVALCEAASGAVLAVSRGTLNDHDAKLARPLWDLIQAGEIVVVDRGFASYVLLAAMQRRRAFVVMRQHQRRKNQAALPAAVGEVVDVDEVWRRPTKPEEWWDTPLPARLRVRVVMKRVSADSVVVVNTNLPREEYSAEAVLEWYLGRQQVETVFREVKVSLGAGLLTAGRPEVAERCLAAAWAVHNLLCCVLAETAAEAGKRRWELSYQTALELVRLVHLTGRELTPEEAGIRGRRELTRYPHPRRTTERREPRARKAARRNYPVLKGPRAQELARRGR